MVGRAKNFRPLGCSVDGCPGEHKARGLCQVHYHRLPNAVAANRERKKRAARRPTVERLKRCEEHKHKPGCRKDRPLCRWRRKPLRCNCSGITWSGGGHAGHRKGSSAGKFGTCEHHPEYAARMYALLAQPALKGRTA